MSAKGWFLISVLESQGERRDDWGYQALMWEAGKAGISAQVEKHWRREGFNETPSIKDVLKGHKNSAVPHPSHSGLFLWLLGKGTYSTGGWKNPLGELLTQEWTIRASYDS